MLHLLTIMVSDYRLDLMNTCSCLMSRPATSQVLCLGMLLMASPQSGLAAVGSRAAGKRPFGGAPQPVPLRWENGRGVVIQTKRGEVDLGGGLPANALRVRFPPAGEEHVLTNATVEAPRAGTLLLRCQVDTPSAGPLAFERTIEARHQAGRIIVVETWRLTPSQAVKADLEFEAGWTLSRYPAGRDPQPQSPGASFVIFPLKNGWARTLPLSGEAAAAEYRLGHFITGKESPQLALPMALVGVGTERAALWTDPEFSSLLSFWAAPDGARATLRYRYAGSQVPLLRPESRRVGWMLPEETDAMSFEQAVDGFFQWMLPDVQPGPAWLHDIAMIGYDFLSDDGRGWERDVRCLAAWLKPKERRRVALCLHGWYDALGSYCYDSAGHKMKDEWTAFARTRKVKFTTADLQRRLRLARDLGFRVLLYFADGLAADSGVPGYHDDWAYRDARGNKITGWQGPDTFGTTYLLDPANPAVREWYLGYLDALLQTYGADVDGVVWDETFHARAGQIARSPEPAYVDRAMFDLVRSLTRRVGEFHPQKVFLASDCIGVAGWEDVPGYAMVADGTYQDSHCDPGAWSYGLFPNWRNTLWSCNWDDITGFHYTRWAVENFGVPVAISNGWGDDCGPSEWQPWQRKRILRLFRGHLRPKAPVRYLLKDPASLLAGSPDQPIAGDPLPAPKPGEVNWALASEGSRARASSCEESTRGHWPPEGVLDGRRDDVGWGAGHGWASRAGQPLPQWLEITFPRSRTISRFVLTTYQRENSLDTAAKWGVTDYSIEVWDGRRKSWKPLVQEARGRVAKVRVHTLAPPVQTERIRVVVERVAPLDGQARLLQVEAWGPRPASE